MAQSDKGHHPALADDGLLPVLAGLVGPQRDAFPAGMRGTFLRSSHPFSPDKIFPEKGRLTDNRMLIIAPSFLFEFPGPSNDMIICNHEYWSSFTSPHVHHC